ncbi:polynucleotide 5'-hydroxyl-kinase NOL9-like isoform X1 [Acipenser ruthenus]|uniref:polynucleotide 5'-hydroxyl-kinase NOL9-like isoform X1 n=2 Tax=Acipenser ruthenus TaxID=7906 RepID=UPI002741045A|nr:polynucleotide 5'-hydroxyl-kinase NOL9-like isoform X1 [Acipenser ruthenus]
MKTNDTKRDGFGLNNKTADNNLTQEERMKVPHSTRAQVRRLKKKRKQQQYRHLVSKPEPCILSPDSALARQYHQATSRGQPTPKRLKHRQPRGVQEAPPISSSLSPPGRKKWSCPQERSPAGTGRKETPHAHSNGSAGRVQQHQQGAPLVPGLQDYEMQMEDTDYWRSFAESAMQNGDHTELSGEDTPPNNSQSQADEEEREDTSYLAAVDDGKGRTVVVMAPGQTLTFRGKSQLTCLYGRVRVFGFTVEEGQPSYPLLSPATHCPLAIQALPHSTGGKTRKERRLEAKAIVKSYLRAGARRSDLMKHVSSETSVLLLELLDTQATRFICSLPAHRDLFTLSVKELGFRQPAPDCPLSAAGVVSLPGSSGLVMSERYSSALSELAHACREEEDGCPVILVCGGKGVGKSSFNRHLINTLLNHVSCVDYLECDLGQTEFTPPGCLSLLSLTDPLLGPPFTHQRPPGRMVYFGEPSCEQDLDRYLESVKYLWSFYQRESPVIINTMGWVRGFGLLLLVDLIRLLCVTHVVQLTHDDPAIAPMPSLSPAYLRQAPGWHTKARGQRSEEEPGCFATPRGHTLLEFTGAGAARNVRYRSNVLRDLALLGYFSELQSAEPELGPALPLHSFTPYQVPMRSVALRVVHCDVAPSHVMYAVNASLVGLCSLAEGVVGASGEGGPVLLTHTPVCDCLGFGVLRGVDVARGLYFIVTPLSVERLRQVNCLLVGSVALPQDLFRSQAGIEGERPYVTSEYRFEVFGAGKLKIRKSLKRREHLGKN